MGRKTKIFLALVVVLSVGAVAGAYAWDNSRSGEIANGITIGGIDVGGLNEAQARELVNHDLVDPLAKPITVRFEGVKYQLSPEKLGVSANVASMVNRALNASQDGGLPARVVRYATNGSVDKKITPHVTYDKGAIDEFVKKVAAQVDRDPTDASVEPSGSTLAPVQGKDGVALDEGHLRHEIKQVIQTSNDGGPRVLNASSDVKRVPPKVTTAHLAQNYPVYLTVDRSNFTLKLWNHLKLAKTYSVAIGAQGFDTPTGLYHIQDKAVNPTWNVPDSAWAGDLAGKSIPGGSPDNPLKARWLGIFDGAGIHGTDDDASIGSAASHGCVRMHISDVIDLYPRVPVGTPIYIG